jgi:menaquinone-dependent protoporphyrinogen oxidase
MRTVIFYATREGHTRRIAEHVATTLRKRAHDVELFDVKTVPGSIDWPPYDWACVAASVHAGHHEPEMIAFVRRHRQALERLGAAFLSVTLSEAGAEDVRARKESRARAAADAQRMIDVFEQETGWRPGHVLAVAGALAYSQYNFIIRFVMKRIARKAGAPTDTSRDYEFTDWSALDGFIGDAVRAVEMTA